MNGSAHARVGGMVRDFHDLVCWQLADALRREVIAFTSRAPCCNDFRYCGQIRDASGSAASNISEGFARFAPGEFARFLSYAKGSLAETQDRLLAGREMRYLSDPLHSRLTNLARAAERTTTALMLRKQREHHAIQERKKRFRRPGQTNPDE